ncbi:phage portal protein [Desulfosporosinus lacus]|uniref:Phage portal protein, HK97 family n=1 Tax=Desulfosporosinus lacus DSM 15449 TaxID=1121420 RepID=A0A1M5WHV6_9FIRM|nr:phage portal protein [Desulfosporosinus lacus]SHH86813.1 phage portal protein, HK97 family [Desulfosporosinus lacus DSM 15449]
MNKVQKFAAKLILGSAWDDVVRSFIQGDDAPVINGQIPISTTTAMKYSAVFGCIRVLSETLASMPAMLYRKKKDGDRESINDLAIYDILHNRPNEEMSPFSFKEMCMVSLNTGGNAVCEKLVNRNGELVGLYPYDWSMTTISRDKGTGKLTYKIRGDVTGKTLQREQVFHIPGLSFNGVIGLSPIEHSASAIRLGLAYEQFGNKFYQNGANASGVFSFPNTLSEAAFLRLKEDLGKSYTGLVNAGKPMLLEEGGDFKQLTMKPADAQLIESKKFQIEDICRIYRVPLHLVQNLDRATNNNIEHQSLEFIMYTMLPWFKRWEEAINMQLLTVQERLAGYYIEFKIDALLRGDAKSRAAAYAVGRQWGWLSVNDIRRLENMNGIGSAGDIYLEPLNMHEAGKPIDPAKSPGPTKDMIDEIYKMINERG